MISRGLAPISVWAPVSVVAIQLIAAEVIIYNLIRLNFFH